MIKRFLFGKPPLAIPVAARPFRTTRNLTDGGEGFIVQWFADSEALARYEAWDREADPARVVVAEEIVQRGGDWLGQRWLDGGARWKHVALARRAEGLTQAQFSDRWRGHAGSAPTKASSSTPIPDIAKGQAYAQNHPMPGRNGAADAITEVWFDDHAAMLARDAWFRAHFAPDDLFAAARFLCVREEVAG